MENPHPHHNQNQNQNQCIRCGTCCKKGAPALHRSDLALVESNAVPLTALHTIRAGEPIWDNVRNEIKPADTDIIKINTVESQMTCIFYDPTAQGCSIYAQRPTECVAQKCWAPEEIQRIYDEERLTRIDLLKGSPSLCDLVQTHQKNCDYDEIAILSDKIKNHAEGAAEKRLLEIIRYDQSIRDLTIEKSHTPPEIINLLFGASLVSTLRRYQLDLSRAPYGYRITASIKNT